MTIKITTSLYSIPNQVTIICAPQDVKEILEKLKILGFNDIDVSPAIGELKLRKTIDAEYNDSEKI